jgi:hypothetical protein
MKRGFVIGNRDIAEALYIKDGSLCYGSDFSVGDIVQVYVRDGSGFMVARNRVINVIGLKMVEEGAAFCDLQSRKYLSWNPSKKDTKGHAGFIRDKVASWETFAIRELPSSPSWLDFYFEVVEKKLLSVLFKLIAAGNPFDLPVLFYLLSSTNRAIIDHEVGKVVSNQSFLNGLLNISNGHHFISSLVHGLLSGSEQKPPALIGRDHDIFGRAIDIENPWITLNSSIRRNIRKTGSSCIVATARNEGVYIVEWVAYHLALGFEKIFLYTNNNQDESLGLLRELHDNGFIELIESDVGAGGNAQAKAYSHAVIGTADVNRYEWCAIIDVDEFLTYDKDKFRSLSDYLGWVGGTGAEVLALSWILVANEVKSENWMTTPVTQRLNTNSPTQSKLIKCISRPERMISSGPHYPISSNGCSLQIINSERRRYIHDRLESPTDITRSASPTFANAYLYHFELKSFPELIWKYSRNRGNYSAINADIQLNDQFLIRVNYFKRCISDGKTSFVRLSVEGEEISLGIERILSTGTIRQRQNEVIKSTTIRYGKLLDYLPSYLEENVCESDAHHIRARDWIVSEFLQVDDLRVVHTDL